MQQHRRPFSGRAFSCIAPSIACATWPPHGPLCVPGARKSHRRRQERLGPERPIGSTLSWKRTPVGSEAHPSQSHTCSRSRARAGHDSLPSWRAKRRSTRCLGARRKADQCRCQSSVDLRRKSMRRRRWRRPWKLYHSHQLYPRRSRTCASASSYTLPDMSSFTWQVCKRAAAQTNASTCGRRAIGQRAQTRYRTP